MPRKSPLASAQPDARSVCGKLLQKGQSVTVLETAIGPREQRALDRKQLSKRASNKPGYVQLTVIG